MIIAQSNTSRFKQIRSAFNVLLFAPPPVTPSDKIIIDRGSYDSEIKEYLHESSTPAPTTAPRTIANTDEALPSPAEPSASTDLNETPSIPHLSHHIATSITLQESHTSQTISITMLPSEREVEADTPVALPKKGRPVARKKVSNTESVNTLDATDTTPTTTARNTRATRQAAQPPKQDSQPTTRSSRRKPAKDA
jgi:hypothetical protein